MLLLAGQHIGFVTDTLKRTACLLLRIFPFQIQFLVPVQYQIQRRVLLSVQANHAIYKLPLRHMDWYTLLFVIPLVTHVYRFIFPMDYILTPILLQKHLLDPPWKQRAQKRNAVLVQLTIYVKMGQLSRICQISRNPTVAYSFPLTHLYNRSCQMKKFLNLDTFLSTTTFRKLVTDFVFPNVFKRAFQLICHFHGVVLHSTRTAHHTIAQAPKGQQDKLVPSLFHFFAERFKRVVFHHDVKPNQVPPPRVKRCRMPYTSLPKPLASACFVPLLFLLRPVSVQSWLEPCGF
ncbi:hypothetical protein NPIL_703511 [Nephila pilipes]|uniref:Uncharacterized protein n=1 Tax=Nephila pilipes TaxID=299642 RepID=A0A8X6MV59_NEPPI|nr:hypothetical protein NPIL_703511 [Nephila pilipes]